MGDVCVSAWSLSLFHGMSLGLLAWHGMSLGFLGVPHESVWALFFAFTGLWGASMVCEVCFSLGLVAFRGIVLLGAGLVGEVRVFAWGL